MNEPDFLTWAQNVDLRTKHDRVEAIKEAIEQAYKQGYTFGVNRGWALEIDKEICRAAANRVAELQYGLKK